MFKHTLMNDEKTFKNYEFFSMKWNSHDYD